MRKDECDILRSAFIDDRCDLRIILDDDMCFVDIHIDRLLQMLRSQSSRSSRGPNASDKKASEKRAALFVKFRLGVVDDDDLALVHCLGNVEASFGRTEHSLGEA